MTDKQTVDPVDGNGQLIVDSSYWTQPIETIEHWTQPQTDRPIVDGIIGRTYCGPSDSIDVRLTGRLVGDPVRQ